EPSLIRLTFRCCERKLGTIIRNLLPRKKLNSKHRELWHNPFCQSSVLRYRWAGDDGFYSRGSALFSAEITILTSVTYNNFASKLPLRLSLDLEATTLLCRVCFWSTQMARKKKTTKRKLAHPSLP